MYVTSKPRRGLNGASFSRTLTEDTNVYQLFSTAVNTFICTATSVCTGAYTGELLGGKRRRAASTSKYEMFALRRHLRDGRSSCELLDIFSTLRKGTILRTSC